MGHRIDIGISEEARIGIADGVAHLLVETAGLYPKTQNAHWDVTGPMFDTPHVMFEQHYTELATAVDQLEERMHALVMPVPGSYARYAELTRIEEEIGGPLTMQMIEQLEKVVVRTARTVLRVADTVHDRPRADVLAQRMCSHGKASWTLRSMLD